MRYYKIGIRMMAATVVLIAATIGGFAVSTALGIALLIVTGVNALTAFILSLIFSRKVKQLKRAVDDAAAAGRSPLGRISGS